MQKTAFVSSRRCVQKLRFCIILKPGQKIRLRGGTQKARIGAFRELFGGARVWYCRPAFIADYLQNGLKTK